MSRIRWMTITLVAIIASGMISYFVTVGCIRTGYCQISTDSKSISMIEALGFAGTMATILAFVATFAIALMAIDAFAISSTVRKSADNIDRFSAEVDEIDNRLKSISASISVFEMLIREIDEASEYDDNLYSLLELLGDRAEKDAMISGMILEGRNSARDRRARINGIRYIASLKFDGVVRAEFGSALPELINQARGGGEAALQIIEGLRELKVSGIPDDIPKNAKKARSRTKKV